MNTRLPKLAQTFVALTLLVAASSCGVTPEVPKESAPKAAANETAPGQHGYVRVRGAITAVATDAITVRTRTGQELRVKIGKNTPVNAITRAEITDIKIENVTDHEQPLVISYHVRFPGYAQRTGKRIFLQPAFFQYGRGPLFATASRKYPIYFHYPWSENDLVEINMPKGYALDNADAYQAIEGLNLTLEAKVHERTVQLEIANEQLREHDRRKNQFLSHVSHDLKTPLTSIVGFIGNMLDGLAGPLQPKQHTYLERVKANAERLSRMISDLLDLSRILFGALHIHRASMSLNDLAQETLDQLQLIADRKSVTLQLQCPHGPITVFADRDRLNQVVTNLLDNALKFTPSGGTVSLCLQQGDDDRVSIAVSDTGCGIPQSAIERLFEAFFQAHPLAAAGREGLGLGLSIVKFLVDLHGGTISVTSREQKGTTFTVHLPKNHPAKADA